MDLYDVIEACVCTPGIKEAAGIPLFLIGPPGGGKTSIITQVAEQYGLHCETILLSVREPADVAGMPTILDDGRVRLAAPEWCQNLVRAKEGILFLDELTCAAPSVQAAALRIVCERVVGDTPLPKGIRVIAAANPVAQVAGGWSISPPMANRFLHYNWGGVTYDQWQDFMLGTLEQERSPVHLTDDQWLDAYSQTKGIVLSFLRTRPNLLGPNVPDNPEKAAGPWESPRTWEMSTRIMAYCAATKKPYIELLGGLVGTGVAKEYSSYEFYADLPLPQKVLRGKERFKHDPRRLDRTLAFLTSVATYVGEKQDLAPQAWSVIDDVSRDARDVAVPAIKALIAKGLVNSNEARKALGYFGQFITCPGLPKEEKEVKPSVQDSLSSLLKLGKPEEVAKFVSSYDKPDIPSAVLVALFARQGKRWNLEDYGVKLEGGERAIEEIWQKVATRLAQQNINDPLLREQGTRNIDTQGKQKQHLKEEIKKHVKLNFRTKIAWERTSPAVLVATVQKQTFVSQIKNGKLESIKL